MAKSRDKAIIELTTIKGIGQKRAEKLYDSGFKTIGSIIGSSVDNIQAKCAISKTLAESILKNALDKNDSKKTVVSDSKKKTISKSVKNPAKTTKPKGSSKKEDTLVVIKPVENEKKVQHIILETAPEIEKKDRASKIVPTKTDEAVHTQDKLATPASDNKDQKSDNKEKLLKEASEKADTSELAMLLNITIAVLVVVTMLLMLRN